MADNIKKRTFEIEIAGVKESVTNLESLEKVLDKMEKQVENINSKGGFSVVSKEANKNTKEAIDLAKAEQIAQGDVISSYKDKQAAMRTLGKEIKSMTVADDEATRKQQEMIQQYNGLNDQLKRFDAAMGNHQRNVGDYRGALKEATSELKSMKGEMVGLDQNSERFKELAKQAGATADKIGDINAAIKRNASDTKSLDDAINLAQSATAAFQLYTGAMSAFGLETKGAEEAMQKLLGAMNIVQSLQTLSETLQSSSATAELFQKAMKMLGLEFLTTGTNAGTAAASTTALATAENGAAVATNTLSTASKALRVALASLGIGLVIMLVSLLIEHWESICNWFTRTFPILKNLTTWFNKVRGAIAGVANAVWAAIKSLGSLGDMMKAIFTGNWGDAINIAKQNIANIVNGFKTGYADKMADIQEEVTAKQAAESNKRTKQELEELKIQERNNKTYSKKYIELQKKEFEERKKMAKGNKDELNKIKLEEMKFYADIEDKKTAAAKSGSKEREKAAKEAAKQAAEAAKKEQEELKALLDSRRALRNEIQNTDIVEQKGLERLQNLRLEGYDTGPIEKYIEELEKLREIQNTIYNKELSLTVASIGDYLEDNIKTIKKTSSEWQEFLLKLNKENLSTIDTLGLEKKEVNMVLAEWQKMEGLKLKAADDSNAKMIEQYKKMLSVVKSEMADFSDDFQRRYKLLIDKVNAIGHEQVERNNIWGTVQTGKTLANLDILKAQWEEAYIDLSKILKKEEERWNQYLENVKNLYGEDSSAFKKAQKEKEDALNPLIEKLNEVWKRSETPLSTETDYTGDGKSDASTKPKRKLWYGKNDKKQDGGEFSLIDNLANMFDSLDEMVLAPAMDTFSMFMDFAIEETQQRLEEVEKMHDDALDKLEDSADKIRELNESLKDSNNTNLEATKQQLADEQLLYAQRLAEERKLAEAEKSLKNKAAQQEANARKMELRYQMVMAIANTAQGASKALGEWGWPLGPIFAGVMAALGAVQVGLIAKQIGAIKPIKYAEGGLIEGPSHSQGGIRIPNTNIEVEGKEFVVNKRSTKKYLPLLEAINAEGKRSFATTDKRIRKFANGGTMNFDRVDDNLKANNETNRLLNAIDGIDMQPVVAVKDIWKVEDRLVKVRSLAGK